MKRILVVVIALSCIAVAGGVYWSVSSTALSVRLAEVKRLSLQGSVDTNGKVEAERVFEIRAPFAGFCRKILVSEGDRLKPLQPILTIDDSQLKADLAAAKSELENAEFEVRTVQRGPTAEELNQADAEIARYRLECENARKSLESNEWLTTRQAVAKWELDQSRREVARTQQLLEAAMTRREDMKNRFTDADRRRTAARADAAHSKIGLLESSIAKSVIRSPAEGTLYHFELKDGAFVNSGDLIGQLADLGKLRVRVFVDEPELGRVVPDSEVLIQWDGRPGESWRGSIARIPSQVVPRGTRSVGEVLCRFEDPARVLIPNLNVDVEIRKPDTLLVPALTRESVSQGPKGHYVWVVRDGRAAMVQVEVGKSTTRLLEITRGLQPGDKVIIPGDAQIQEGTRVRVAQ